MKFRIPAAVGLAAAMTVAGAHAATFYDHDFSALGIQASPGSLAAAFSADAGAAVVKLQLDGYLTLDGDNDWIDIFHLFVNGSEVFAGTFDMSGGGINRILYNPGGASAVTTTNAYGLGGKTDIVVPVVLLAGSNGIAFSYESPTTFEGIPRNGPQSIDDEGWGLHRVLVSSVPEPQPGALLLAGLAAFGVLVRRTRRVRS
jgi:MYXO-CTERM domain-containing protein